MHRLRFNIAGLLVFILICGVAFAALKEANNLWEHGIFSLTLLVLVTAVLLAIHRSGARRSFWLGFALFGGCYLGFSLFPSIESRLVSSQGLSYLHSKLPGQPANTLAFTVTSSGTSVVATQPRSITLTVNGGNQLTTGSSGLAQAWTLNSGTRLTGWGGSLENFVKIGHSLLALFLAWFGGLFSRRLSRASRLAEGASQAEFDAD